MTMDSDVRYRYPQNNPSRTPFPTPQQPFQSGPSSTANQWGPPDQRLLLTGLLQGAHHQNKLVGMCQQQERDQNKPTTVPPPHGYAYPKRSCSNPTSTSNNNNNNNNTVNNPLFSSDSEDEGDISFDTCDVFRDPSSGRVVAVIDDYDLPFVRLVDRLVYLVKLYKTNSAAFWQEFRHPNNSNSNSAGGSGSGSPFGHNFKPKEHRPKLITKGIEYFKRRRLNSNMSRVYGDNHKAWVLRVALASRLILLVIQFLANNLPQSFKHANDGFKFTPEPSYGKFLDSFVNSTVGGFVNWDAHYFLHISVHGYTSENMLAFFPLLPMILYLPSRVAYFLMSSIISLSSLVLVTGVVVNTWVFVKCAGNMYELAKRWVGGSPAMVTTICMLFCFNPASIFFSGLYTETLFAYLTSNVILSIANRNNLEAIISAALSCLCRSNGILNVGFIIAFSLQRDLCRRNNTPFQFVAFAVRSGVTFIQSVVPFILFQIYAVRTFCKESELFDPGNIPLYCSFNPSRRPTSWTLPYSYVQNKYWNVGFLNYFQVKQIPNFMLATPVLYVLGSKSLSALKATIIHMKTNNTFAGIFYASQAVHGLFLTLFCFLFVHVQVSTRMIMSSCPYIFMYMTLSYWDEIEKFRSREIPLPVHSLSLLLWFALYYLVGTVLFSLGLPWT